MGQPRLLQSSQKQWPTPASRAAAEWKSTCPSGDRGKAGVSWAKAVAPPLSQGPGCGWTPQHDSPGRTGTSGSGDHPLKVWDISSEKHVLFRSQAEGRPLTVTVGGPQAPPASCPPRQGNRRTRRLGGGQMATWTASQPAGHTPGDGPLQPEHLLKVPPYPAPLCVRTGGHRLRRPWAKCPKSRPHHAEGECQPYPTEGLHAR